MAFISLNEYLNSSGKMEKPKIKDVADYVDAPKGREIKPPKAVGMKNDQQPQVSEDSGKLTLPSLKSGAYPYHSKGTTAPDGFGYAGDKEMAVNFDTQVPSTMVKEAAYYELFPVVREMIQNDPYLMEQFIRELKRNNSLGALVAEVMQHSEAYGHIAELLGSKSYGENASSKLARAMLEAVAPPMTAANKVDMEFEDEEDDEDDYDMDMDDDEDIDIGMDDEIDDEMDMADDDEMDMGDEEELDIGDDEMGPEPPMGDEDDMLDDEDIEMDRDFKSMMKRKKRRPPAFEHLLSAMGKLGMLGN